MGMHPYPAQVLNSLRGRNPWETEFLQAVEEVFESVSPLFELNPQYASEAILERMTEPERIISFRVPWTDDQGRHRVNRGFRVQFNSALGPYKGGLRFHPSVTQSSLKFLGFEQGFKNALTGLPMGGGKGGADFDFRNCTDRERMAFCQSFMSELYRHIGPDIDVPAGDIGVGAREIGYLFGQYKRLTGSFHGVLTGKRLEWGGSLLRPEATGYGIVYLADAMLRAAGEGLEGKRIALSGFGNVAWGVARKAEELGGVVISLSGPDGSIHDPEGIRGEKLEYMLEMRLSPRDEIRPYADRFKVEFRPGRRPWDLPCELAIPCAIQNELDEDDARSLVRNQCRYVVEGANMPCTAGAVEVLQGAGLVFVPGKAANAGGVAVSGLEMAQNSARRSWPAEEIDTLLRATMETIHDTCLQVAEEVGQAGDYVVGANIAGFRKVADAMIDQGLV